MNHSKDIIANLLLILLSVSFVFIGLEVALVTHLISGGGTDHKWCQGPEDRMRFHPEFGWTEHPNHQYIQRKRPVEPWALHTINSEGFRDTYNSGDKNVIVLGDSFTNGALADDNATYPHLLDRWTPNVSFRNYGTGGFGPSQYYLVYKNVSEKYSHDTVVVGYYFGNDMRNVVANDSRRPQFTVKNESLVQTQEPAEGEGGLITTEPLADLHGFLLKNTESYLYLGTKIKATLRVAGVVGPPEPPSSDRMQEQKQVTGMLLNEIAKDASRNNATVLIVGIPERGEVNPDKPAYLKPADAERYGDAQRKMLRKVASANPNTYYLDLKPSLSKEREKGKRVYGVENSHLNERGYRVAAQLIYYWMVNNSELEPDPEINLTIQYDKNRTSCP